MSKNNKKIVTSISNPEEQNLIVRHLASFGYEILHYHEEGWTQADLFILDTKSASEIGKQILDLKQKVDTLLPVLIILDKDDDLDFWLSEGFDDCLLLPISDVELKAKVGLLLRLREKSKKLTQKGESIYQAIFEATGTATLIVDEDTTIIMANKTCSQVTGYSPEELIGTSWTKYVAPESLEMMLRYHKLRREDPEKAPFQYEVKLINKSGEERIALLQVKMIPETKRSVVSMLDITEQKRAEEMMIRQQKLLMAITRAQQNFIANMDISSTFKNMLTDILAITDSEYGFIGEVLLTPNGQPYLKTHAITNISWDDETRRLYEEKASEGFEFYNLKTLFGATLTSGDVVISNDPLNDPRRGGLPKGHPPMNAYLGLPIKFADKLVAMVGIANRPDGYDYNIVNFLQPLLNTIGQLLEAHHNQRLAKQSADALREKEREVSTLLSNLPGMAYRRLNDKNWTMLFVSDGCYELTGYLPEDLINNKKISFNDLILEEYQTYLWEKWQKLIQEKNFPFEDEYQIRTASGEIKWVWEKGRGVFDENGELLFLEGYIQDITDRKNAEDLVAERAKAWQRTFDAVNSVIWIMDKDMRILQSNKAVEQYFHLSCNEIVGRHCWEYVHNTAEPIPECPVFKVRKSLRRESVELRINGNWFEIVSDPIIDIDGNIDGFVHIITDITERKRMEKALIENEESYRRLFEDHAAVKLLIDPDTGQIVDANKAAVNFYGWSREELKRMKIQQINTLPPEEIKKEMEKARTLKKTYFEFRHRLADSSIRDVRVFSSKVEIKGKEYLHSIIHDITREKELEAQLYQAQKLESIGQLAGGIAHDFNNMLNVILGYGEMILNKLHPQDPIRKDILQIIEAGRRSMSLTQQLLAFSRKQILQPKILNINESLKAIEEMLRRLIGENIELTMVLAEDISNVKADPGQIEQVIMNLVVNARDAMPYGGKLIIETANVVLDELYIQNHVSVEPGDYVMIAITDTGIGMDKEILSRLFEPFFTTKEKGKGTGLGLSTVYGIVKQSGGHIHVYSELGKGSTFKIYLPAVYETKTEVKKEEIDAELKVGGEHILIVEDEPSLQDLFKEMLTLLGYQVTVAANGGEALLLVEEKGIKPDLVITDVIMPIMDGKVLVERLRKNHPNIKALYMSGYTDNAIAHYGVLDESTPFIQKPFTIKDLSLKIKQVLGTEK
ncbi:sensory box histidine kinase/response regulator [Thermodesulfovibrio sp. N1]|uniref:PAS domain S-box protein n=1 Tax=Thermodesulfovibrio sp. N1 TaxID=1871110 RepID=UPI00083A9E89|nr:PAS domain S-box protein [Thermodesulfovibrio sp. N1]ODA44412.1 sensory box histidine kinase/response regulator [Thermodesulfovibrio sp. N1]